MDLFSGRVGSEAGSGRLKQDRPRTRSGGRGAPGSGRAGISQTSGRWGYVLEVRSLAFCTLPIALRGKLSTKTIRLGVL